MREQAAGSGLACKPAHLVAVRHGVAIHAQYRRAKPLLPLCRLVHDAVIWAAHASIFKFDVSRPHRRAHAHADAPQPDPNQSDLCPQCTHRQLAQHTKTHDDDTHPWRRGRRLPAQRPSAPLASAPGPQRQRLQRLQRSPHSVAGAMPRAAARATTGRSAPATVPTVRLSHS